MTTTEAIRLQLRSWPEVEAYLERCKGVIVPLGSTEQHGPTGAIGTDALTAEAVALEVGRRSGVLVTPAQAFGMAEHHLGFAGTVSLQPSTLSLSLLLTVNAPPCILAKLCEKDKPIPTP